MARKRTEEQPPSADESTEKRPRTMRATMHVPPDLWDRARAAVDALSGPPERMTITALIERALEREVVALEKKHNKGKPFPAIAGRITRTRV